MGIYYLSYQIIKFLFTDFWWIDFEISFRNKRLIMDIKDNNEKKCIALRAISIENFIPFPPKKPCET